MYDRPFLSNLTPISSSISPLFLESDWLDKQVWLAFNQAAFLAGKCLLFYFLIVLLGTVVNTMFLFNIAFLLYSPYICINSNMALLCISLKLGQ